MTLAPGTRLGPYEILAPIGSGGMGEVWKARDTKLDRMVAIKVLPEHLTSHPEALARFEREAKAVAALSHPNILAIYEFGNVEGLVFTVMELLEGETLRARLDRGALPQRKALEIGAQIVQGLAAAHERGIIHRDIKPENLFLSKEGRLKILDYGLAKQQSFLASGLRGSADSLQPTQAVSPGLRTSEGAILGTVGYMSPEQVRGEEVDPRSDIFSFGVVLFEMLSGRRAFHKPTTAETLTAILKEDPLEEPVDFPTVSPAADRILRHCLEKNPSERFQSASDLAFDLMSVSGGSISGSGQLRASANKRSRAALWAAAAAAILLPLAAYLAGRESAGTSDPSIQRLTFQRGTVETARFAPDGKTIVYSARWQGRPPALFSIQPGSPESRPLGLENASLHAVSATNELAVKLAPHLWYGMYAGRLARVPLNGGGTRDIQDSILRADWTAAGELVITHPLNSAWRLECPPGKVVYESPNYLDFPRAARKGSAIAIFEGGTGSNWTLFPLPGQITLVEPGSKARILAKGVTCTGLAWSPDGSEIWFSECAEGSRSRLWGLSLKGRRRLIWSSAGNLALEDVSPNGRVLMTQRQTQSSVLGLGAGAVRDTDLSIYDGSNASDITADGRRLLINENGSGAGEKGAIFLRGMDGSAPVNLGGGVGLSLSPDASMVVADQPDQTDRLRLIPTGMGRSQEIQFKGFRDVGGAWFFPDGRSMVFTARHGSESSRHFLMKLEGGEPRPITPEGFGQWQGQRIVSPDGQWLAVNQDTDSGPLNQIIPVGDGKTRTVPGLGPRTIPIRWTPDGKGFYIFNRGELPVRIERLDLATGARYLVKEFVPADPGGIAGAQSLVMSPDARVFAFNVRRTLSDLYLMEGLK